MGDTRGQIVLVAALGIAITFVALALIVNTVIFTENLATRDTVQGDDAVAFEQTVNQSAATLLGFANRDNTTSNDYDTLVDAYRQDLGTMSDGNRLLGASSGRITSADLTEVHNGTWVRQDAVSSFVDDQGNDTWQVAPDVHRTRRFVLHITDVGPDPFVLRVNNSTSTWEMTVDRPSDYTITVDAPGAPAETKTVAASNLTVGVTTGTVNGTSWSPLVFGEGVGRPYDVTFENTTNTTGTYHLMVDREKGPLVSDLPDSNYGTTGSDPDLTTAIYKATIHVTVEEPDLYYETNVTVEPDGPPNP